MYSALRHVVAWRWNRLGGAVPRAVPLRPRRTPSSVAGRPARGPAAGEGARPTWPHRDTPLGGTADATRWRGRLTRPPPKPRPSRRKSRQIRLLFRHVFQIEINNSFVISMAPTVH